MGRFLSNPSTAFRAKKTARAALSLLGFLLFFASLMFLSPLYGGATSAEVTEQLRQQMNEIQAQIDQYRANIQSLQKEENSLKREISLLDSRIKTANLEIQRTNLFINQTEEDIKNKDVGMREAELKVGREKKILGEYVRALDEFDRRDFLEMILNNEKISDIFDEMNSLEEIQRKIRESMADIRGLKVDLQAQKDELEDKREELNQLKVLQEIQKRTIAIEQNEKQTLLNQTKGQEGNYQALIKKAQQDTNAIRQQLYMLEGVGLSMSLERAYGYARLAGDLTGVRPAFLLAVLKKESSWGEKVGTGTWRKDMHTRDQKAFVEICDKLGRDPDKTPVSRKPSYGWGGAMGPAQFLPSTWLAYEKQIANLTGHNPPDPWDIGDAFVAAGIKMAQAGANLQTENAEWKAAQVYFAGSRWNNPTYYFYGDQVMELARTIQEQLDLINR